MTGKWASILLLTYATAGIAAEARDWTPQKLSFEELAAKSRLIVVAADVGPDETLSPEPCLAIARTFKVQAVVRNLTNVPTPAGTRIQVLPYVHFQMKNRCSKNGYVRNFRQEQYFPKRLPTKTEPSILFLTIASGKLYYQAIDSLESATLLPEVINQAPLRCEELRTRYHEVLQNLSEDCGTDKDCAAYDFDARLGGCGREVFHQRALPDPTRDFLSLLTKKGNETCTRPLGDCEKIHVTPACRRNKCINLVRQPDPEMFLPEGSISHGCAPFDGPALQFKVAVRGEEASVIISIYQDFPSLGQPFELSWGQSQRTGNSPYTAYCAGKRSCVAAESGKLTLDNYGGDSAPSRGEFTLQFKDGSSLRGKALFRPAPRQGTAIHQCG